MYANSPTTRKEKLKKQNKTKQSKNITQNFTKWNATRISLSNLIFSTSHQKKKNEERERGRKEGRKKGKGNLLYWYFGWGCYFHTSILYANKCIKHPWKDLNFQVLGYLCISILRITYCLIDLCVLCHVIFRFTENYNPFSILHVWTVTYKASPRGDTGRDAPACAGAHQCLDSGDWTAWNPTTRMRQQLCTIRKRSQSIHSMDDQCSENFFSSHDSSN